MTRRFRAPGRVNLIGSHVDVQGGLVLPMALHLATEVAGEVGGDRVRLTSATEPGVVDVPADGSARLGGRDVPAWGRYVASVVAELAHRGRPPVGLVGAVTSTVPAGAGLSSSAALTVAVATALCAAADLRLPALELAAACQRAEENAGVPVGLMDPAVAVLGTPTGALLLDCRSLEHRPVPMPDTHRVVIVDSGVRRRLGDGRYAERRSEVQRGLDRLQRDHPPLRSLRDAEPDLVDELAAVDPVAHRRCRHVVTEIARVREVVAALDAGDVGAAGALFSESHRSDVEDYEASHPEVDALVTALEAMPGVAGARMTGGGFGGVVVALIAAEHTDRVVGTLSPRPAFVAVPSPGAAEVT